MSDNKERAISSWDQSGMSLDDPFDSPGYYEQSSAMRPQSFSFRERPRKKVDTKPNLHETFTLTQPIIVLAFETNAPISQGYRSLHIPAHHPIWRAQQWDVAEENLQDGYQTKIQGRTYSFSSLGDFQPLRGPELEKPEIIPASVAQAIILHLRTGV